MNVRRGDILLADFPHAAGTQTKQRPVLVVQADYYSRRIHNVVVALITSNLKNAADAAHLRIDLNSPEGRASGLQRDSLVSAINLVTLHEQRLDTKIGRLTKKTMERIDQCLKAALGVH